MYLWYAYTICTYICVYVDSYRLVYILEMRDVHCGRLSVSGQGVGAVQQSGTPENASNCRGEHACMEANLN